MKTALVILDMLNDFVDGVLANSAAEPIIGPIAALAAKARHDPNWVVVFANDEQIAGKHARAAALSAGATRIRPVLMTALAMIIGMLPMSLGLGEGGEQNAPLGRAVVGGLLMATFTTLLIVPVIYSYLRHKAPIDYDQAIFFEEHEGELPSDLGKA